MRVEDGFIGSLGQWVHSLKGADGVNRQTGSLGQDGRDGSNRAKGEDGKDAFQMAQADGFTGSTASGSLR